MLRRALLTFSLFILAAPAYAADREEAEAALVDGVNIARAGNVAAGRIRLLNAIKEDPQWALPHAVLASLILTQGDGYGAETEAKRAVELGMKPARVKHLLAHALLLKGDAQGALQLAGQPDIDPRFKGYAARIRARALTKIGDFGAASRDYDLAIQLNPKSAATWGDLGSFRFDIGNVSGAIEATAQSIKLNPRRVETLAMMGMMVREQFGLTAAIPWYRQALELAPNNLDLMKEFAATLGDAGQTVEMLEVTRSMLLADPKNPYAFYYQAVLAARAKKYDLARSLLYRTDDKLNDVPAVLLLRSAIELQLGSPDLAIASLEDLVAQQPGNLTAQRLLGAALWASGDMPGTADALRRSADRADADSYTLTRMGRALEAGGNMGPAMDYLDRVGDPVREFTPVFAMAGDLVRLAKAGNGPSDNADIAVPYINKLMLDGQLALALAQAERLRARNGGAPAAHVLVGDVLMAQNRVNEAVGAYRSAASIRFTEPVALRLYDALVRNGEKPAALTVLDLFLTQNPRNVSALRLAADHFIEAKKWDAAIGVLTNLSDRLGPHDASVANQLGWAWFNKSDQKKALDFAANAYVAVPTNPAFADTYGWVLFKSGSDAKGGIALMKKAVAIVPGHPGLRYRLGQALAASGQKAEAKVHLLAAANTNGFEDAKAALQLLTKL
jgi:cellulose synthase operon protein C